MIGFFWCFPGSAVITTPTGPKNMRDVQVGDTVRVVTPEGRAEWSQTCGWLHRSPEEEAEYVQLTTSLRKLAVSDSHLVGVVGKGGQVEFVPASEVKVGMTLLECDVNPQAIPRAPGHPMAWGNTVTAVGRTKAKGVYAPLTVAGTIVVDGVAASCYAATRSHRAAHAAMKPMRSMWKHDPERMMKEPQASKHVAGAHRYVDMLAGVRMAVSHHHKK